MAARSDELRKEVGAQLDPPSLAYFAKAHEMEEFLGGDDEVRGRLVKRWRRKYSAHRKKTAAQAAARAAARKKARSS